MDRLVDVVVVANCLVLLAQALGLSGGRGEGGGRWTGEEHTEGAGREDGGVGLGWARYKERGGELREVRGRSDIGVLGGRMKERDLGSGEGLDKGKEVRRVGRWR